MKTICLFIIVAIVPRGSFGQIYTCIDSDSLLAREYHVVTESRLVGKDTILSGEYFYNSNGKLDSMRFPPQFAFDTSGTGIGRNYMFNTTRFNYKDGKLISEYRFTGDSVYTIKYYTYKEGRISTEQDIAEYDGSITTLKYYYDGDCLKSKVDTVKKKGMKFLCDNSGRIIQQEPYYNQTLYKSTFIYIDTLGSFLRTNYNSKGNVEGTAFEKFNNRKLPIIEVITGLNQNGTIANYFYDHGLLIRYEVILLDSQEKDTFIIKYSR